MKNTKIKINLNDNTKCADDCKYLDKYYILYNNKYFIDKIYCDLFDGVLINDMNRCDECKKFLKK